VPIEKDVTLVCVKLERQPTLGQYIRPSKVFKSRERIAPCKNRAVVFGDAKAFAQASLAQLPCSLVGIGGGEVDRPVGRSVTVVVHDEGSFITASIGVCEDALVHRSRTLVKVVEQEVAAFCEQPALLQQGSNFTLVAFDQPLIRGLVVARTLVLHAVLFGEALDLTVAKHGKTRE